jgi:hypothetical protein
MICSGMLLSLGWTLQLNIGQETLRGLMANWMTRRRQRSSTTSTAANGDAESGIGEHHPDRRPSSDDSHDDSNSHQPLVLPAFEFSTSSPPSIITEGSQGGPWRKKASELDGSEDEKDLPWWVMDCVLHNRLPPRENAKYFSSSSDRVLLLSLRLLKSLLLRAVNTLFKLFDSPCQNWLRRSTSSSLL